MRSFIAMSFAAALLCACGQSDMSETDQPPAAPAVTQGVAENFSPDTLPVPPATPASQDILEGISEGKSAVMRFDACPRTNFDERAQLAAIMCGRDYTVWYEADTQRWAAIGPNREFEAQGLDNINAAAKNPGPPPAERRIVIWGLAFLINDSREAITGDGTVVGHLVHPPAR